MFKFYVIVVCVVYVQDKFFIVEEIINGKVLWNQLVGYFEVNEMLLQVVECELWEEIGICVMLQYFICMYQWLVFDNMLFLCFLFVIEFSDLCVIELYDSDIDCCLWFSVEEIFNVLNLCLLLVVESICCYLQDLWQLLLLIGVFNWLFIGGE